MRSWTHFAFALSLATGCSFDLGLDGDQTPGEEGRSAWSLEDGLCPGLGGSCSFDVALAVGATVGVRVEVPDRSVSDLLVTVEGPATLGALVFDDERGLLRLDVSATGGGEVVLHLVDSDGEEIDRARFQTRTPARMECGVLAEGQAPSVAGDAITASHAATLIAPRTATDDDDQVQLSCVVLDEAGEPLLSVRLVRWDVLDGLEAIHLRSEPFESDPPETTHGARVWVDAVAVGTAQIEARLGDSLESFTITVG